MTKAVKIRVKIVLVYAILVFCIGVPAFSQAPQFSIKELRNTVDDFSDNLAKSLPFNSAMGLNWADAYIKNFPHFGVGFSLGYTTMDSDSFGELLDKFCISLPSFVSGFGGYPIPGYALEARLGGFYLPFDIGFKFGYLPMKPKQFDSLDYLLVGGDVRFAVLKENILLPTISLGLGFNRMSGGIGQSVGKDVEYAYDPLDPTAFITVTRPKVNIDWATSSLDFKAQISKSFIAVTPYLGVGASTGWSKVGYGVKSTVTDSKDHLEDVKAIFRQNGINDLDHTGFSSEVKQQGWSFRAYGGLSFNITVIRLELTGLYNFIDKNYGITVGARFQI